MKRFGLKVFRLGSKRNVLLKYSKNNGLERVREETLLRERDRKKRKVRE